MPADFQIAHCPAVDLVQLPDPAVTTFDGHEIDIGTVCYFRFAATDAASEYRVVSDRAVQRKDGFDAVVVGPRGCISTRDVKDLVVDPQLWWEFRMKRR